MKFACNYYQETEQLLDENKIDIDYLKYPGLGFQMPLMEDLDAYETFCDRVTKKRPILLHGLYPAPHDLSSPTLQESFDSETANRLISMTKTPGLSFHPAISKIATDIPFHKTLSCIIENAIFIKEKYRNMDFVSIENCDSIQWGDLIKPQTINELITESGCEFLLDISHAYCASRLLGIPFHDYLRSLPLKDIVEIHINGWITTQNDVMCHTKINEEGYEALDLILSFCNPKIITIEYGRHNDRINSGVPVLTLEKVNEMAKIEIEEQVFRIRKLCTKKGY